MVLLVNDGEALRQLRVALEDTGRFRVRAVGVDGWASPAISLRPQVIVADLQVVAGDDFKARCLRRRAPVPTR